MIDPMTANVDRPGPPLDDESREDPAAADDPAGAADGLAGAGDPAGDPAGHPVHASPGRPRGLDAFFPPGGEDEAPPERIADERRLTRLLVGMVLLLVGVPTLLTLVAFAGQLLAMRGGG
jgi:hypothetical protein